jgi:hypothetical protein
MIESIVITETDRHPYREVILNGELCERIDDSNSPTGHRGWTRSVFMHDDYIVKIGSIGEAFMMIEEKDRGNFAEVVLVDINKRWIVQKRVNVADWYELDERWSKVLNLARQYDIGDVAYKRYEGEKVTHNWTVDTNGNPVIFDYDQNPENGFGFEDWQYLSRDEDEDEYAYEDEDEPQCSCTGCRPSYLNEELEKIEGE